MSCAISSWPGFRVVCNQPAPVRRAGAGLPLEWRGRQLVFKYRSGGDLTIACYNFALRDGAALAERLAAAGVHSDLFHVNYVPAWTLSRCSSRARARAASWSWTIPRPSRSSATPW